MKSLMWLSLTIGMITDLGFVGYISLSDWDNLFFCGIFCYVIALVANTRENDSFMYLSSIFLHAVMIVVGRTNLLIQCYVLCKLWTQIMIIANFEKESFATLL